jgi:pimeloyl-ACP methyl ester carboxylesterase
MATRPPARAREQVVSAPRSAVRVWRGGDGPPLVVVTDCGDPLELWAPAFSELGSCYSVTMLEQPGFGYSDAGPDFDYRWAAHFDALRFALDELVVEDAFGLGHCVAGTQLLALDADGPGRLRAAVLAETFPAARYRALGTGLALHRVARLPLVGDVLARAASGRGIRRGARYLLGRLGAGSGWPGPEAVDAYASPIEEGHNVRGGLLHVRRWDGAVAEPVELASRLPAAYLFGAGGHFARHLPERERYAASCDRPVSVLDGCGHFLFAERPAGFASRVTQLLGALDVDR